MITSIGITLIVVGYIVHRLWGNQTPFGILNTRADLIAGSLLAGGLLVIIVALLTLTWRYLP